MRLKIFIVFCFPSCVNVSSFFYFECVGIFFLLFAVVVGLVVFAIVLFKRLLLLWWAQRPRHRLSWFAFLAPLKPLQRRLFSLLIHLKIKTNGWTMLLLSSLRVCKQNDQMDECVWTTNLPASSTGSIASASAFPFSVVSTAAVEDSTGFSSSSVVVGASFSSTAGLTTVSVSSPDATTGESSTSSTTFSVTLLSTTGVSLFNKKKSRQMKENVF